MEEPKPLNEIVPMVPCSPRIEIINTRNIVPVKDGLMRAIAKETEENPEAEAIIRKIDFEELRNIVTGRLQEICPEVTREEINIIPAESIKFKKKFAVASIRGHGATYDPLTNIIIFEHHQLEGMFPDAINEAAAYVCFHEEIHAISKNICEFGTYESRIKQRGYCYEYMYGRYLLEFFDEAVTEKMTREIVEEYEKRKGILITDGLKLAYNDHLVFLDKLIEKISAKTRTDNSEVWRKIQREKILGKEKGRECLMEELEKIFSYDHHRKTKY